MNFWPEIPNMNQTCKPLSVIFRHFFKTPSPPWFPNNYHSFFTIYISDVLLAHKKGERNAKELKNVNLFCENPTPLFAKNSFIPKKLYILLINICKIVKKLPRILKITTTPQGAWQKAFISMPQITKYHFLIGSFTDRFFPDFLWRSLW